MQIPNSRFYYVLGGLVLIGIIRIIFTYSTFWQSFDEPVHIAAGMVWLDKGQYVYDILTPPLARIMTAIGPFLDGSRSMGHENSWREGNEILHGQNHYEHTLTLARLGILPFFILAAMIVGFWAKHYYTVHAALLSVVLFTTLPPILGHSGMAATDMALAATFVAALFALCLWLEKPTLLRSQLLGLTLALTVLAKFSGLFFFSACIPLIVMVFYSQNALARNTPSLGMKQRFFAFGVASLIFCSVIWAGYRFSTRTLFQVENRPHSSIDGMVGTQGYLHDTVYSLAEHLAVIPAPEFFDGLDSAESRVASGHRSFLMGEIRTDGWWYYYPVTLAVKTPLPFLFLAFTGFVISVRKAIEDPQNLVRTIPGLAALGLLLISMTTNLNIGVRLILPIYPLLAITAGYGGYSIWQMRDHRFLCRVFLSILVLWQLVTSFKVHPDYLAYFNELAGNRPEEIVVVCDLDWGQDLKRLVSTVKERNIETLALCYTGSFDLSKSQLPPLRPLNPEQPTPGWVAVSISCLQRGTLAAPHYQYKWLNSYEPVERVGRSIRLYHIPEQTE